MVIAVPSKRLFAFFIDLFFNSIFIASWFFGILIAISPELANVGIAIFFSGVVFSIIAGIIQIIFMCKGQTIGKKLLKLKVIDKRTNETFGFFKMFLRDYIGKSISGMFGGLGWIWILIDEENQGWHDKVFESLVVEIE